MDAKGALFANLDSTRTPGLHKSRLARGVPSRAVVGAFQMLSAGGDNILFPYKDVAHVEQRPAAPTTQSGNGPRQVHRAGVTQLLCGSSRLGGISVADLAPRKMPARAKDSRRPSGPSLLRPVAHEPQGCAAMSTPARLTATRAFASAA